PRPSPARFSATGSARTQTANGPEPRCSTNSVRALCGLAARLGFHDGLLHDANRHVLDAVVPVAQAVPLGAIRLRTARAIRGASAEAHHARGLDASDHLPPLPAVTGALADQTRFLPRAAADADLDARNGCRARPGHAADA